MSFVQIDMSWEKAWSQYYEEFAEWLMKNELCWNGDRLTELMEDPDKFENFIADVHPEIGELT